MSPRTVSDDILRQVTPLEADQTLESAVAAILDAGLPALPVVDGGGKFAGIFGEREFIGALFPAYLGDLKYAGFVKKAVEEVIEKRAACFAEPVSGYLNTDHIDVGPDHGDVQLAEIFLHHRVLIIPVVDEGTVVGIVTRSDFFAALASRMQAE